MPKSIIPDSHQNRLSFLMGLESIIMSNGAALNWDPAKRTAVAAILDPLITAYQALVDAENAVVTASANAAQVFAAANTDLQKLIAELKANPGCTAGMQAEMKLVTTFTKPAPAAMQPKIKASAQPGHVRLTGSKDYADLVNIYMRRVGTAAWTLVGIRRMKFPFDDQTPLQTPGVAESREYQARAVVGDAEVGVPSDIVQVTYAG